MTQRPAATGGTPNGHRTQSRRSPPMIYAIRLFLARRRAWLSYTFRLREHQQ